MPWRQGLWERKRVHPGWLSANLLPADECRWVLTFSTLLCPGRVQCMMWSDLAQLCGHPEKHIGRFITVSHIWSHLSSAASLPCPGHTSVTHVQMIKASWKEMNREGGRSRSTLRQDPQWEIYWWWWYDCWFRCCSFAKGYDAASRAASIFKFCLYEYQKVTSRPSLGIRTQ